MKARLLASLLILTASAYAADRPNIVVILADDLGLGDVSFHARQIQKKEPLVETPNIDALAKQGMWFTDGHSPTSLCAQTRYAMMSGNNNYRCYAPAGVWSTFAPTAFEPGHATLGTVVRDAGYHTGIIGKWHMGGDFHEKGSEKIYRGDTRGDIVDQVDLTRWVGGGPRYCGFDYDFITPCGIQGPLYLLYENEEWYPWAEDSKIIHFNEETAKFPEDLSNKGDGPGDSNWDSRQLADILSGKAVDFIKDKAKDKDPFFLYYCMPLVHLPHCPPDTFDGEKIKGRTVSEHLDMVVTLDLEIKRIVDALKETGEFDNTLFILTSDNGGLNDPEAAEHGYHPSGGWSGYKGSPLEGGHRVPFIAVWPGKIDASISNELVVGQDLVATLANLVGTTIPKGQAQDSNNLLPLLTGEGTFRPRKTWINQAGSKQEVMIRQMPWKLIIQSNFKRTKFKPKALYNIEADPQEKNNLFMVTAQKERVKQMFGEYMDTVKSGRPTAPGLQ